MCIFIQHIALLWYSRECCFNTISSCSNRHVWLSQTHTLPSWTAVGPATSSEVAQELNKKSEFHRVTNVVAPLWPPSKPAGPKRAHSNIQAMNPLPDGLIQTGQSCLNIKRVSCTVLGNNYQNDVQDSVFIQIYIYSCLKCWLLKVVPGRI